MITGHSGYQEMTGGCKEEKEMHTEGKRPPERFRHRWNIKRIKGKKSKAIL
jgi:hypothetical protein